MAITLYEHQRKALQEMKNGCILAGGTGSGKSITSLAYYYFVVCKGGLKMNCSGSFHKMKEPRDLYIITTAKKRDNGEWEDELSRFSLGSGKNECHGITITIDSWNNIKKYDKVFIAFFIFDEQRVVGWGAWSKAFLRITRRNQWVLLSATPGDTWLDYIPVFIANGFYKTKSEFYRQHVHVEYLGSGYKRFPKIAGYLNEGVLIRHRNDILIKMDFDRSTRAERVNVPCSYDKALYKRVWKDRWDPYDDAPIEETGKLFYLLRKVVNDDASRTERVLDIYGRHKKLIIFYNFTYEVERLREVFRDRGVPMGEWNGQVHSEVPSTKRWVYFVQYSAGSEGWNCITTDTIVFYSQSYSYRMTKQAEGRIDRLNTPFDILYYYTLRSNAPIDLAIQKALVNKRNFNEKGFLSGK